MYRLYDFSCVNKHTTEELINPDVKEISCSICGESGKRLISPSRFKFNIHNDRWAKQHEKAAKVT
jgi:hypothetical protein